MSEFPKDQNPTVPPQYNSAFPWVRVFTSDAEFGKAAVQAIKSQFSNAFTNRGVVEWKKAKANKPVKVEFFYTLGQDKTKKGEEVDTIDEILTFVLSELHNMGAR